MSLTIPAVQSAREAGRRAECANNIRQLSLACQTHNSSRNRIPGYVEYLKLKPTAAKPNPGNRRITWAVRLLPYMEESGLWEAWNDADTSTTNYLAPLKDVFTCKSNPILATEGPVN